MSPAGERAREAAPLAGRRVLVPRSDPDDPVLVAVRAAGGSPVPTALVRHLPAEPGALDAALRALAGGRYDWLAVTSATTVRVLADLAAARGTSLAELPARTRVAAVGPGTAAALRAAGFRVDLVPPGPASAADLVAAWPPALPGGTVLVPRSAIAAPTLVEGLRSAGWDVEDVVAYSTRTGDADTRVAADLRAGGIDVVLLTSGSTARALVELYGRPDAAVVAIGAATARAARACGLAVAAVADEQTPAGLVRAAARALAPARHDVRTDFP